MYKDGKHHSSVIVLTLVLSTIMYLHMNLIPWTSPFFDHFSGIQIPYKGSETGGGEGQGARLCVSILTVVHNVWVCVGRERVANRGLQT